MGAELLSRDVSASIVSVLDSLHNRLLLLEREQQAVAASLADVEASSVTESQIAEQRAMMAKVNAYKEKLVAMKSAMSLMTVRTRVMKSRADKLKTIKLNHLTNMNDMQQIERAHDESVVAKLASSPEVSTTTSNFIPDLDTPPLKAATKKPKKKKLRARAVQIGEEDQDRPAWTPSKRPT